MESTILNPPLPFMGDIPNGLYPGRVIVIQGFIHYGAQRFRVDLTCPPDNLALHVNPRFDQGCVVRNHYNYGNWGEEERYPPGLGGFVQGQGFEMMILTEATHYKIAISGRHLAEFVHRLPFQTVRTLQIQGDNLQVHRIEFKQNYSAPAYPVVSGFPAAVCPPGPPMPTPCSSKHMPIYNPAIPFLYPISGGIQPNYVICLSGRPTNNPHRFTIDLKCGNAPYPVPDVGLHICVRFDQFCVVRNSLINDQWGLEERQGDFPFRAAVNFDMVLKIQFGHFEICINGQYFGAFQHRIMPVQRIDFIRVDGDVVLSSLRFL